jgi:hypothetical protein
VDVDPLSLRRSGSGWFDRVVLVEDEEPIEPPIVVQLRR